MPPSPVLLAPKWHHEVKKPVPFLPSTDLLSWREISSCMFSSFYLGFLLLAAKYSLTDTISGGSWCTERKPNGAPMFTINSYNDIIIVFPVKWLLSEMLFFFTFSLLYEKKVLSLNWGDTSGINTQLSLLAGLPWWLSSKESASQCRRRGLDPWVRKFPWRRKWQSTPVFWPGKSHGQRSLAGYI